MVFRRALEGLVPTEILDRPKQGFDVPLGDWLTGDLWPLVEQLLLAKGGPIHRWFEPAAIHRLWTRFHRRRDGRFAFQIWRLLNLAVWFSAHVLFRTVEKVDTGVIHTIAPELASLDLVALAITAAALIAMLRFKAGMLIVLGIAGAIGAAVPLLG